MSSERLNGLATICIDEKELLDEIVMDASINKFTYANIRRKIKDNIYNLSNKNVFWCIKVFIRNIIIIIIILKDPSF